jgi:proline dehydrogenase
MFRTAILRTASLPPIKAAVKNTPLFRPVVTRFIAGDTVEEAVSVAERLASEGFFVTLDQLGENVADAEAATRELESYINLVHQIAKSERHGQINISIKLTALGLDQGDEVAEANFRRLLTAARASDTFVRADMEGSPYTERTVQMIERVFPDLDNTGTVLQSYLYSCDSHVERLIRLGSRVRLVKGAYLEPESVAYQSKSDVDANYVECAKKLMLRGRYPAIATHDESIVNELLAFAEGNGIHPGRFEWQMLYGIRRDLQAKLRVMGHNVRIYVPFGSAWYPYFTRRLAERPANMLFILRSFVK